jgi:hypothetical protein
MYGWGDVTPLAPPPNIALSLLVRTPLLLVFSLFFVCASVSKN